MSLFTQYEERPPGCQAVPVTFNTVDEIAGYFASAVGYETTVTRTSEHTQLHIFHPGTGERPGCNITVTLPHNMPEDGEPKYWMLKYNHPPSIQEVGEFHRQYREAPTITAKS